MDWVPYLIAALSLVALIASFATRRGPRASTATRLLAQPSPGSPETVDDGRMSRLEESVGQVRATLS